MTSSGDKSFRKLTLDDFVTQLAAKQPTPGGGASGAVSAAIGAATASMAAAYSQRKKDVESGAAAHATKLQDSLDLATLLQSADDDAQAYADLQATWKKDHGLSEDQVIEIQQRALQVPTNLLEICHAHILAINDFLPHHCNPNIVSDAKVGIHELAGAARSAYQTVLVNQPPVDEKKRLRELLREIQAIENKLLELQNGS